MITDLTIYRRHLPHWRLDGSIYFVTWTLDRAQPVLSPDERSLIRNSLFHFDGIRYRLEVYVVMDDHVHILVIPFELWTLQKLIQSWKRHTSAEMLRRFGRKAPVWKREYMDRIVRNELEYLEKANYILTNPVRRWPEVGDYPWVGLGEAR